VCYAVEYDTGGPPDWVRHVDGGYWWRVETDSSRHSVRFRTKSAAINWVTKLAEDIEQTDLHEIEQRLRRLAQRIDAEKSPRYARSRGHVLHCLIGHHDRLARRYRELKAESKT